MLVPQGVGQASLRDRPERGGPKFQLASHSQNPLVYRARRQNQKLVSYDT